MEAPMWYYEDTVFDIRSFDKFMNFTYSSIANAMSSSPSDSGGSDGGGRGSW